MKKISEYEKNLLQSTLAVAACTALALTMMSLPPEAPVEVSVRPVSEMPFMPPSSLASPSPAPRPSEYPPALPLDLASQPVWEISTPSPLPSTSPSSPAPSSESACTVVAGSLLPPEGCLTPPMRDPIHPDGTPVLP